MHILLTILSVIGKVLLILLLIILALLLILLLVPLRYQLQGKKEKGIPPNGSVRVTFLFRLIDLQIRIRSKDDISGQLRVAGFRIRSFGKNNTGEPGKKQSSETEKKEKPKLPEGTEAPVQKSELKPSGKTETSQKQTQLKPSGEPETAEKKKSARPAAPKQSLKEKLEKKTAIVRKTEKQVKAQKETFAGRVSDFMQKICDAFLYLFDTAYSIEEKADRIEAKISEAEQTLSYWDTGRHRNAVRYIIRRLFILLKHYMPRRMKGYLHFGTGRPHLTGYAAGLLSVLLPAGAGGYELKPEFYEACLETDTIASGHIRSFHISIFALAILLKKDCRVLIRSALRWRKKKKQI